MAEEIKEEGERAALETGVNGLHPDIIKLIIKNLRTTNKSIVRYYNITPIVNIKNTGVIYK